MASLSSSSSPAPQNIPPKKPRHRHSPAQLAALNELFDKNEHPPLEQRTALAERLGMEPKTVNAWFQNKRASSKKRTRGAPSDAASINNAVSVPQAPPQNSQIHSGSVDPEEYQDDDFSTDIHMSRSASHQQDAMSYYPGNMDHTHFLIENDAMMPRRMRMRPSVEQTDELRKLYSLNPHPTAEQRQTLSERIGMRYQSITNWFQNQRSLAKKRKEDELDNLLLAANPAESSFELRQYSGYPPPAHHPSLALPSSFNHLPPSLPLRSQRSLSPPIEQTSPRRSLRRSTTPYNGSNFSRPRRSRPEPYQLDALKELYMKTATPTIEERSALALEIGMDVSKVTNWFRNLRQTARKRTRKGGNADDDDYGGFPGQGSYSAGGSRSGTPSLRSSTSSMNDDSMELDDFDMHDIPSDLGSEDEYQEPVTPSPEHSPSPAPAEPSSRISIGALNILADPAYYAELEKVSIKQYSGVRIEDALLLLSFHHHVMH